MRKKSVLAFAGSVAFLAWRRSDDFGENRVADLCAAFGEAVDGFADFTPKPAFDAYGRAVASEDAGAGRVSVPVSETPVYFLGAWPTEIAKPSAPPVIGLAQKFRFFSPNCLSLFHEMW